MSKFKNRLAMVFVIAFCLFFATSCAGTNNTKTLNFNTLEYYKNNGYFEIKDSKFVTFETSPSNIVFVDSTKLIKANSTLIFHLNNSSLDTINLSENSNPSNINFNTGEILSGFDISGKFYDYYSIENLTLKVTSDIIVSPKFSDFEIIGTFVYCMSDYNPNSDKASSNSEFINSIYETNNGLISSTDDFLLIAYFDSINFSLVTTKNFKTNSTSNYKLVRANDNFELKTSFEIPTETYSICYGIIIKDLDNNIQLISYGFKDVIEDDSTNIEIDDLLNRVGSINKITISASNNLSFSESYSK